MSVRVIIDGSGEDGSDVDVDLPVANQVTVEDQDVGVRHGHRLAVLAEVLHVDLRDRGVAGLEHVPDVMREAADCREETGDGFPDRFTAGDRLRVAEAERHARREGGDGLIRVERVDVRESPGYVSAHAALPRWRPRALNPELYAV